MLKLPDDGHRHAIFGMTGMGKTVNGLWHLSRRRFDQKPWIIVDFKRDLIVKQIPRLEEIGIDDAIPKRPGLYVVRPEMQDESTGPVTDFFYRVWKREHTGLFIDEGYGVHPRDKGLRAVLTQGRSKRIPVIALSQRPAWVSPFILSESEFKSIFFLQTPADIDRVQEWLPRKHSGNIRVDPSSLQPAHSYWYCMHTREFRAFGPCPDENEVLDIFDRRRVKRYFL
jgi:hypothetical protein